MRVDKGAVAWVTHIRHVSQVGVVGPRRPRLYIFLNNTSHEIGNWEKAFSIKVKSRKQFIVTVILRQVHTGSHTSSVIWRHHLRQICAGLCFKMYWRSIDNTLHDTSTQRQRRNPWWHDVSNTDRLLLTLCAQIALPCLNNDGDNNFAENKIVFFTMLLLRLHDPNEDLSLAVTSTIPVPFSTPNRRIMIAPRALSV